MSYRKNVHLAEFIWLSFVTLEQLAKQILTLAFLLTLLAKYGIIPLGPLALPLRDFLQRHLGDERIARGHEGHKAPKRVVAQQLVEPRYLADKTVVPLRAVDGSDGALDVESCFEKAEFPREGDFAQDLSFNISTASKSDQCRLSKNICSDRSRKYLFQTQLHPQGVESRLQDI